MAVEGTPGNDTVRERLLLALAEELKLPLLHVAQQTELYAQQGIELDAIRSSAQHGLLLIDGYVLSQTLHQQALELEPVSISSLLYDVAHALLPLAKQYDCTLNLHVEGKHLPVMSHRAALRAALTGMSTALITAVNKPGQVITLGAHKSGEHITAGIFTDTPGLSDKVLRQGRMLYGRARQPLQSFTTHPAAGVFVADDLLQMIGSELRIAQHNNQKGLATFLTPSQQLTLV